MLTVAFFGDDSETYVLRPFAVMHARGTCVANEEDVLDSLREHWRSACRAAVGAICDMIVLASDGCRSEVALYNACDEQKYLEQRR